MGIKKGSHRTSKKDICDFLNISFDEHFHGTSDQVIAEISSHFRKRMKHAGGSGDKQLPDTNDTIDFSGIHCANHLVLTGLYIPNGIQILGSIFDRRTHLDKSFFLGAIDIGECDFLERFDCSKNKICKGEPDEYQDALTIFNSNFHKRADFSSCEFNGSIQLRGNQFDKVVRVRTY